MGRTIGDFSLPVPPCPGGDRTLAGSHETLDIAPLLGLMARDGAEPRLSAPQFV